MQFKGSVRAPGDKDPGIRVVLEIDEYHLEFRRDSELIGRYYLAEVEVARDIAERFILFLGDDEVEFLADDALQFAYGGVAAMQDGWLAAQKKKRRHRRAAEAAARRKDDEPVPESETVSRPIHVSDSDTLRSRRLQTGAKPPAPVASGRRTPGVKPAAPIETPAEEHEETAAEKQTGTPTHTRKARRQSPLDYPAPDVEVEPAVATFATEGAATEPVQPKRAASPKAPRKSAAATGRQPKASKTEAGSLVPDAVESIPTASPMADSVAHSVTRDSASEAPAREAVASKAADPSEDDTSLAARRKKITDATKGGEDLGRVRVPEPISARARGTESGQPEVEPGRAKSTNGSDGDVRYAQAGHHPFETSTGLLAKLRRPPKRPVNHVHNFKESGSSVGLVRRVCIECSFVSIGSNDE